MSKSTPLGAVAKFAAAGKTRAEEGPRAAGDRLRQRLRRPGRDGRRPAADAAGVPRGGGLRRPVAGHRLQPLHRARHRDARRARPAVPGGGQRLLAAGPLRPGGARRPAATRSCSTRRGRASRSPSTRNRELRYRSLANTDPAEAERLHALAQQAVARAGTSTRRWRPAAPQHFAADAAQGAADGPLDALPGPGTAQPARRLRLAAVVDRRRRAAARRRRRRRGRAATRCSRSRCAGRRPRTRDSSTPAPRASPSRSPTSRRRCRGRARARAATSACSSGPPAAVEIPVIGSLNGVTPGGWAELRARDAGRRARRRSS